MLLRSWKKAFVSGYNIGDEYLGKGKFGHWRDAAVIIEGPIVDCYTRVFLQDWRYASFEDLVNDRDLYCAEESGKDIPVQETHGGPDMPGTNSIHMQYVSIATASREQIWLTTPYLGPSDAVLYQLRLKALAGADVRVLASTSPGVPSTQTFSYSIPSYSSIGTISSVASR